MRLSEIAQLLGAELRPRDAEADILNVASPASARAQSLVFAEDASAVPAALASEAAAVIVPSKCAPGIAKKPLILASQPKLAFARAAQLLRPVPATTGVHSTAVVDPSTQLDETISVEAYCVIEADVRVGSGTRIGAGSVIGRGVVIGRGCRIYPRVVIYPGTELGDNVVVHAGAVLGSDGFGYVRDRDTGEYLQFPQQGRLVLEDNVEIGANTTIDRGALEETRIGRGVKIDNLVHLGHNVLVGRDVVIAAQTGVSGSSTIGAGAVVGGQVGIGDHAHVGEQVILGSGSGVLTKKKVRGAGTVFWGRPARPLRQYLRELAVLARLGRASDKQED
ncbi:MAG TPA: UDP-3-O-(3-hydroxymyristoyl)glucosamine N-acyltransferase [Acidobacteriaceae bacterium]|nr:UDP-3-O-(3-hydroxymyristoyl)glucosamine N-acyltransferase [Acidobacteriaceae bacterium]